MNTLPYTMTLERNHYLELTTLAKTLDVWCIQHFGLPGLNANWHRDRNRIYEKKGPTRYSKIYYTTYRFREQEHLFEFKLAHL